MADDPFAAYRVKSDPFASYRVDTGAEEESSWDELNSEKRTINRSEDDVAASTAKEGVFARAERLRKEKLAKIKNQPLSVLNQLKVDPFSAAGGAYSDLKELLTGDRSEYAPEASVPSIVKGAVGVPMRLYQGATNLAAPDSEAAKSANRMVDSANQWYRGQGLDESKYGEGIGESVALAGVPLGAGAKFLQGGGRLAQLAKNVGYGSAVGGAMSQAVQPKENIRDSQQYRDEALSDLIGGAVAGGVAPALQEGAGELGRRVSPYLRDFKEMLREKVALMSRNGETRPAAAFLEDIGQRQSASNLVGSKIYEKAHEKFGGLKTPAAAEISTYLDETVLPSLKSQPVLDKNLISSLEELSSRLKPGRDPNTGRMVPPEADARVQNLVDLVRNLRSQSQLASETAGATVQKTRTGAEKKVYSELDDIIESAIRKKDENAANAYSEARRFWREGDPVFAAPSAFTDETRAGRTISTLRGTDQPDVKFANTMKTKSGDLATSIGEVTSKRGKNAMQVEFLQQAEKADKPMHPEEFISVFQDKNGDLLPMVKTAFKGDDLKALQGMLRIKKFSSLASQATNIAGATLVGGAGAGMGAAGLQGMALWARRGTWIPNVTARGWERLINNRGTRSALAVMATAPPSSPQAAKALAILEQASKDQEDE